jgi:ribosome biogenesis GTPase A
MQLLDTPGVLWPKLEDQQAARRLAYTGAIRDRILDMEQLACGLLLLLLDGYGAFLERRYKVPVSEMRAIAGSDGSGWALLEYIGKKRGMLIAGGEIDTERAAAMVLDEFRGGKIGRISLELPDGM